MSTFDDPEQGPTEATPLVDTSVVDRKEDDTHKTVSITEEVVDTIKLGIPIFVAMVSWVGMKTTDTALLGHVSAEALAAAALSDLWTMTTGVLTQGRILSVLCGSAIGAGNPKLAGIYLQVSYYVLAHVALFVALAWSFTEPVLLALGSNSHIAHMAGYYAKVLALSIPGTIAFGQLSQFFSAQRILQPSVHASATGLLANLILGMIFVLGIPFGKAYGFAACPIVTTAVIYIQLFLFWFVYIYIQKLHLICWPGWSWNEITKERIKTYCNIYVPAALSSASDFWRVAVIGTVAAKLGEEQVAVFNSSYRIMWIALVLVNSLVSASAINMTQRLGKMDHIGAKQAGHVGIGLAAVVLVVLGILIVTHVRMFGRIFTNDERFLSLFEAARVPFSLTLVLMNLGVAIERIPYSMGRTTEVFWIGLVASWGAQVPAVILFTTYWRNNLIGLYTGMAVGYFVLVVLYSIIAFTSDWKKHAELARQRSEMSN